jgi:hypothetical protein
MSARSNPPCHLASHYMTRARARARGRMVEPNSSEQKQTLEDLLSEQSPRRRRQAPALFSAYLIENGVRRRARRDELALAWRLWCRHADIRTAPEKVT